MKPTKGKIVLLLYDNMEEPQPMTGNIYHPADQATRPYGYIAYSQPAESKKF